MSKAFQDPGVLVALITQGCLILALVLKHFLGVRDDEAPEEISPEAFQKSLLEAALHAIDMAERELDYLRGIDRKYWRLKATCQDCFSELSHYSTGLEKLLDTFSIPYEKKKFDFQDKELEEKEPAKAPGR